MTTNASPTPARPALDASLAKVKAFLAFDSFPAGETTSPTFEALRVVIDDYDRGVRSLADMRGVLEKAAAQFEFYASGHERLALEGWRNADTRAGYARKAATNRELAAACREALARSAP